MTGRDKLIKWATNISEYELSEPDGYAPCPHWVGLDPNDDLCINDCLKCWQQALEKEYPDES